MKKVTVLAAVLIAMMFAVGGCSQDQGKGQGKQQEKQADLQNSGQVRDDLAKYMPAQEQAMKPWAKISGMSEELKKSKTAKEYTTRIRNEFVPLVTGVISQMEAIKPSTKEVQDLHNSYLASIRDYLSGLQSMADAVEKNDDVTVSTASVKLNAFPLAHSRFLESANALAVKSSVKPQ